MTVPDYRYWVTVEDVHDGDTITVVIDLGFDVTTRQKVRLAGLDAPELSTPAGKVARAFLADLVNAHPGHWTAQTYKSGHDKYGRWLATVYTPDGTSINQTMVDTGHARPWDGQGPKPNVTDSGQ